MNDQLEAVLDYPADLPAGLFGMMLQPSDDSPPESDADPLLVENEGSDCD